MSSTGRAPAMALPMTVVVHEPLSARPVDKLRLMSINRALRHRCRVALAVIAIGICNVLSTELLHPQPLLSGYGDGIVAVGFELVAGGEVVHRIDGTAVKGEIGKFCDERGVFVIDLVAATKGGPI